MTYSSIIGLLLTAIGLFLYIVQEPDYTYKEFYIAAMLGAGLGLLIGGFLGYAQKKRKKIIEPKFEMGTVFNKGKAIVAFGCEKVPWGNHEDEDGCHHYSLVCKSFKAINVKGKYISEASESFETLAKSINWVNPELF